MGRLAILAVVACLQVGAFGQDVRWKPVGSRGIEVGLAGPVGAAVEETWFSLDGGTLYVQLASGAVWSTGDVGLTWASIDAAGASLAVGRRFVGAGGDGLENRVVRDPFGPGASYSLGRDLLRSNDGGTSWTNLSAGSLGSVIGDWQSSIAFSPVDPDLVVVGNSMGVWKSFDRGVTWTSLNRGLPNFPPAKFVDDGHAGSIRVSAEKIGTLELAGSGSVGFWQLRRSPSAKPASFSGDDGIRRARRSPTLPDGFDVSYRIWRLGVAISPDLTACATVDCSDPREHFVSAFGGNGRLWAGTSDGRIWVSQADGRDWRLSFRDVAGRRVEQIWVDPANPEAAVATIGGSVLRSTNGGVFWDEIGSDLPESTWTSVVGHPDAGALYVAGSAGVFFSRVELDKPGPAGVWRSLNGNLPRVPVDDLRVDLTSGRMYVIQQGYGVFQSRLPTVEAAIRALNAADLSSRPGAPGSLITIRGMSVDHVRAGDLTAPILARGPSETHVQLPFGLSGDSVKLTVRSSAAEHALSISFNEVSPAIFIQDGDPLVLSAGNGALIDWSRPARPGSRLLIMATGLGRVSPAWPTGLAAPLADAPKPVARITASLNGLPLRVVSSQLAAGYVGTYLVEVELPISVTPGGGELRIQANGVESNAAALIVAP